MRRKFKKLRLIENLEIQAAVAEGNCIARTDNQVVFVKFAAPGDIADVQVVAKKKNYQEGRIVKLHKASEKRVEPFCQHYQTCGGCKWQHLDYTEQLAFKQQQVIDAFERLAGLTDFEVLPIFGAPQTHEYRNKLDLTFSNRGWITTFDPTADTRPNALGFHIPGRFDKVMDIEKCHLMTNYVNDIQRGVKAFCDEHGYTFYDLIAQQGLMRNLMLRCNRKGEWMVLVSFFEDDAEKREALLNYIRDTFDKVTSLVYVINPKKNDTLQDLEVQCYHGNDHLIEELGGLKFKIRPQSFFQCLPNRLHRKHERNRLRRGWLCSTRDRLHHRRHSGEVFVRFGHLLDRSHQERGRRQGVRTQRVPRLIGTIKRTPGKPGVLLFPGWFAIAS